MADQNLDIKKLTNGLYEKDSNGVWRNVFDGTPYNGRGFENGVQVEEIIVEETFTGIEGSLADPVDGSSTSNDTVVLKPPTHARPRVNKGKVGAPVGETIRYPSSYPITAGTDYVSIDFYQYQPPFGNRPGESTVVESDDEDVTGQLYQNYNHSVGDNALTKRADGYKSILLFMPEDVNTQYGANWGGVGVGIGQANVASMIGTKTQINKLGDMWSSSSNALTGGAVQSGFGVAKDLMNLTMGGSLTTDQLLSSVSGRIINPNVELMYEAPELRGFNLNFKMMPRDPQEAKDIFSICQTLKRAMLPSWGGVMKGDDLNGSFLTLPKIASVKFMTGNNLNKYVTQYKPCAITNVSINYTPDGSYATYQDGSPVATLLSVQFKELKLVFEQEVPLSDVPVATY